MPSSKKLLILEAHAGGGHISISQAISEALQNYPHIHITRLNIIPDSLKKIYEPITRQKSYTMSEIYRLVYKLSDNPEAADAIGKINVLINQHRFARFLHYHRPDTILSNAHWAVQDVPYILNKVYHRIPFLVFVADPFSVHSIWYSQLADHTFVPTLHAYSQALNRGITQPHLTLSGHPIREKFYNHPKSIKKLRQKLNLNPDLFTMYFGGSGEGIQKLIIILTQLSEQRTPFQGLIFTGNNQQLKNQIEAIKFPKQTNLITYGYVDDPSPYMHASDIVVGKAGPNLVFESAIAGKPFIAIHHVKGNESANIDLIKHMQIGLIEENPLKAAQLLIQIIAQPQFLNWTKPGMNAIRQQHQPAAATIANITNEYISQKRPLEMQWPQPSALNTYMQETISELNGTLQLLTKRVKLQPEFIPLLKEFRKRFDRLKHFIDHEQ